MNAKQALQISTKYVESIYPQTIQYGNLPKILKEIGNRAKTGSTALNSNTVITSSEADELRRNGFVVLQGYQHNWYQASCDIPNSPYTYVNWSKAK